MDHLDPVALVLGHTLAHARSAGKAGPRRKEVAREPAKASLAGEKPLAILTSHCRAAAEEAPLFLTSQGRETRSALPGRPSR